MLAQRFSVRLSQTSRVIRANPLQVLPRHRPSVAGAVAFATGHDRVCDDVVQTRG
jgi:hypothetical protein